MKNTISAIAKEMETFTAKPPRLGLRSGLTGISLFFFYYARLTGDKRYAELADNGLDKVITYVPHYMSYYFVPEFADIGRTFDLLVTEKFIEIPTEELVIYFENRLIRRLRNDTGMNFGFCTGITGICDYFLNKANSREALDISFEHIYRGLNVKGYLKHRMNQLFLFPSEILRDVKIFFLKLEKANITIPEKESLYKAIRKLESKKILQSNCQKYSILQDLREAEILEDKRKIRSSLENIVANPSNLIFKGLAALSLEDSTFSSWYSLA